MSDVKSIKLHDILCDAFNMDLHGVFTRKKDGQTYLLMKI